MCREHATDRMVVVKLYSEEMKPAFLREARNLASLQGFSGCPGLLFAIEIPQGRCNWPYTYSALGMQYFPGKSLQEWKTQLAESDRLMIAESLHQLLSHLHDEIGMVHGDFSPRNILAQSMSLEQSSGSPAPRYWKIQLIDWEFGELYQQQNLSSHSHYRGTVGFRSMGPNDPKLKDWEGFEACLKFIDLEHQKCRKEYWNSHSETGKPQLKVMGWKSWISALNFWK